MVSACTSGEAKPALTVGATVKFANPETESEAQARFGVVELRDDRVLIRLRCNLPISPMECVRLTEVTVAEWTIIAARGVITYRCPTP
jgi:hypothetical protein